MIQLKTLNKRISTKSPGVFYKEIVNEDAKVVDKIYSIRWTDKDGIGRLKTVGKFSQGIRISTCASLRHAVQENMTIHLVTAYYTSYYTICSTR